MKVTKNRVWNLIMQEADKIKTRSHDHKEMLFKLSALPATISKQVEELTNEKI